MAEGATFSVVPFINRKAVGSISGIVGAGGNVGAFLAAMLLKSKSAVAESTALKANSALGEEAMKAAQASAASSAVSSGYFLLGGFIVASAALSLIIKFATADEKAAVEEIKGSLQWSRADN
jgi:NNP family nitrate/nitrite transporter-like MFS transporter